VERESWWAFAFFTPAAAALAPTDSSPGRKEGRKGENAVEDRRGGVSSQSRERAVDICVIGDISGFSG